MARTLWPDRSHPLVTTNLVIGETWTVICRRARHQDAVDFVERVERSPRVAILRVDEETEREAWTWLRRHDERVYSFVDATSFAMMRKLGLLEALAFDGDFSAAGFVEVRP
jgi:predicted nucleic acid-binding protein